VSRERFSFPAQAATRLGGQIVKLPVLGKLPVALLIHGGPQSSFGNEAGPTAANPRLFASPGYAAVSVDFTGLRSMCQAFTGRNQPRLGRGSVA
jgi:dipeptidyl aminopeptidase/acylaminoacyl peptidase